MLATIHGMATKKQADRHKPSRMVRIPEVIARALEQIGEEQFNSLTEQVKVACREYLEKHGRLPRPSKPAHKS